MNSSVSPIQEGVPARAIPECANANHAGSSGLIKAGPIGIAWDPDLSIYASEGFLRSVSEEYGWVGGTDDSAKLRCILPYTIVRKSTIRMVRFRVETIAVGENLTTEEEESFLENSTHYFRSLGADVIIPASTNTIFRAYPRNAVAAPYGSYIIDLNQPEETLWDNLHSKHRNVIRNARKKGVQICSGNEYAETAYEVVRETFRRSSMAFMNKDAFRRMLDGLGDYVKIFVAKLHDEIQGCAVIPFSQHSAYYAYGGSAVHPLSGATNLLQWEAIRCFRSMGVKRYDFCGVRINPEAGSKAAGLMMYKERFGGHLVHGYMWRDSLRPVRAAVYRLAVRFLRGGDIVDQEKHKLVNFAIPNSPAMPDSDAN